MKRIKSSLLKRLRTTIKDIYGFDLPKDWVFYTRNNKKIWLTNQDVDNLEKKNLNIETIGIYFCYIDENTLRLSPEGAQLVGEKATKNVLDISLEDANKIIRGFDIEVKNNLDATYVILRSPLGIIGVGKNHKTKILCQIRKNRRIRALN